MSIKISTRRQKCYFFFVKSKNETNINAFVNIAVVLQWTMKLNHENLIMEKLETHLKFSVSYDILLSYIYTPFLSFNLNKYLLSNDRPPYTYTFLFLLVRVYDDGTFNVYQETDKKSKR